MSEHISAAEWRIRPKAKPKYRNRQIGGYHSKKEALRAAELKLLEKAGKIRNLREQVPFVLIPAQGKERPIKYFADFTYEEYQELAPLGSRQERPEGWYRVVEDCKGMRTKDYILKRKMLKWFHQIEIRET